MAFVHLTDPRWSNPGHQRSQHHVNQRFFEGDPESITRSEFTISYSESTCRKSIKRLYSSTLMGTRLIIESDHTFSFPCLKWCNPNFFSSGPSCVHQIWLIDHTLKNLNSKIVNFGNFGPLRVVCVPKTLFLRVNIINYHWFSSNPIPISWFWRSLIFLDHISLNLIM